MFLFLLHTRLLARSGHLLSSQRSSIAALHCLIYGLRFLWGRVEGQRKLPLDGTKTIRLHRSVSEATVLWPIDPGTGRNCHVTIVN